MNYIILIIFIFFGSLLIISIINAWMRTAELRRNARFGMDKLVYVRKSRVHFVEFGEGPNLVLLPGLFESYRTWNSVLPALSSNFRCICFNYFGSGDSERASEFKCELGEMSEFIIDFLDRLHIEITHFLGVGFGASLVFDLAARFPLCVHRSVTIEGVLNFTMPFTLGEKRLFSILKIPVIGDLSHLIHRSGIFNQSKLKKLLHSTWNEMSHIEQQNFLNDISLSFFETSRMSSLLLAQSWFRQSKLIDNVPKIEVPILQLMGTESEYKSILEPTNDLLKGVPIVTRWLVQDGVHQLHWQYPRWVARVVTHFLKEKNIFSKPDSGGLWEVQVM